MSVRPLCMLALGAALSVGPGCAPRLKMTALIQMIDAQEKYFAQEVVPEFERKHKVDIAVVHVKNIDSLDAEIAKYPGQVGLVKVPFGKSWSLVGKGRIMPLNAVLTERDLRDFRSTYLLTSLGQSSDGKQYFVPRKFETRIMVYRKSKVRDALGAWRTHKAAVDSALKELNGYGLPATYILEKDPNQWDFFDVFVVGWVWARTAYEGKAFPRIAHRGRRYSGTSLGLVDQAFQCGADSNAVLTMDGESVVDAFEWEAAYVSAGIYNKNMWEQSWSGTDIWKAMGAGEVFMAAMTQLDCFFIHGTGRDSLNGYLKDPDDMGVATMPAGCSLELDRSKNVLRQGCKSITTGGWWWGIPADSPFPELSYALERHITSTKSQVQECTRFGMIPVRKDILSDMSMMFGGGWITDVYQTSFQQLIQNKGVVVPTNPHFDQISECYLDAWFEVAVHPDWTAGHGLSRRQFVEGVLENKYRPRVKSILGR